MTMKIYTADEIANMQAEELWLALAVLQQQACDIEQRLVSETSCPTDDDKTRWETASSAVANIRKRLVEWFL